MRRQVKAAKGQSAKCAQRGKRDGFVAEPPIALVMGALALGMLVGALLAPAPGSTDNQSQPATSAR